MVFRKYRAVKQWGKMDTRIFKEIHSSRNKRKMPAFEIPEAVKGLRVIFESNKELQLVPFYDPNSNFKALQGQNLKAETPEVPTSNSFGEKHPLQQDRPAFIFEASEPLCDGIAEAAQLTKSVVRNGLPETILHNPAAKLDIDEDMVRDAIRHGENYDPTLEKLPARFDPVMFWIRHVRLHGTPIIKKNNIILNNLLRQVQFAGLRTSAFAQNLYINRDEPLSVLLSGGRYFSNTPLVIRAQPHLTVQSTDSIVAEPWAGKLDVEAASAEPLPNIYPISPTIDFEKQTIYNDELLLTRKNDPINLHSLLWAREQDQKYPWTTEQNMANAIMTTYGAAVAQATRNNCRELRKPVLVRGVQLCNGRLDLVALQLNTLNLIGQDKDDVKNIIWVEKGLRLYKPRPFYEQMEVVESLDMDVFRKFVALMVGYGVIHAH